ncbi:pentapeptide repeat-containing protein [Nissabacter archeti]|uniref:Pentapeptide repeat-containing protein n=1 Tax=Nissabacter archeti TaxID=1917880 RepID=A0ABS5JLX3_9GAMM|nr:pentapeptide repeat-containing protein [Nissabacter archeti]MBS0970935.1 pentapeptide repeat-containing protein [Nissabacter archeti]
MRHYRPVENRHFRSLRIKDKRISGLGFYQCTFEGCDFSSLALTGCMFEQCEFINCSLANLTHQQLSVLSVRFQSCKVLGIEWASLNIPLAFCMTGCKLIYNTFHGNSLPEIEFSHCNLIDTQFSRCDLRKSNFTGSEFIHTTFEHCCLNGANFLDSEGLVLDAESNAITEVSLPLDAALGLLQKYRLTIR